MSFKVSFRLAPPQQQTNFSRFLHIIYSLFNTLHFDFYWLFYDSINYARASDHGTVDYRKTGPYRHFFCLINLALKSIKVIEHLNKQQLMKRSTVMYWSLQWPSCKAMYMYTIKLVVMQRRYIHWLRVFKCTWKINWNDAHRV